MRGRASPARAGNAGLPVGFLVVKAAGRHAPFRDICPGLIGTGKFCDDASCRDRNAAALTRLILSHPEITRRLGRRGRRFSERLRNRKTKEKNR